MCCVSESCNHTSTLITTKILFLLGDLLKQVAGDHRWTMRRRLRNILLSYINTLRTGSFKLFKRPLPGFLTILTL